MTHDIARSLRSPFGSGLIDQHSPAARSSIIQSSDLRPPWDCCPFRASLDRHWDALPTAFTTPTKIQAGMARPAPIGCCLVAAYDIMATKTGPHAVSKILPIA